MLDNTSSQPSKFSKKNWVEKNDDRNGTFAKKILSLKLQC